MEYERMTKKVYKNKENETSEEEREKAETGRKGEA